MTTQIDAFPLEEHIARWRNYQRRRRAVKDSDLGVLEGHLREEFAALTKAGLAEDEAFLVAVKRMGSIDALSRQFALEHSELLLKQWATASEINDARSPGPAEKLVVLILTAVAALAIKIPVLFGVPLGGGNNLFYARNASLFVLPLLAVYFFWKRRLGITQGLWLGLPFFAGAVFANVYPSTAGSVTEALTALHLPIALWLAVGLAYAGGRWFTGNSRMDFVRFSGELGIYYVLMALGGGVLAGFTMMMFHAIQLDAKWLVQGWIIPCGAMGATIVGAWLVEGKQGVLENIAPILSRLFTPLFTVLLLVFLATTAWTGSPVDVKREVLIGFDLLLALVVGLVLYAVSARDPQAPPNYFDGLQLLLVASALVVDGVALAAIAGRISEFGFTPNRVAALGENLILLVNLAWSGWLYASFMRHRVSFTALEQWQAAYLPVYAIWAALVVVVFPLIFSFR